MTGSKAGECGGSETSSPNAECSPSGREPKPTSGTRLTYSSVARIDRRNIKSLIHKRLSVDFPVIESG
jgi:hypothetical protein